MCDPKIHGTSNLLSHIPRCLKKPNCLVNDPNQAALTCRPGEAGGLIAASTRFNLQACRRALAMFVIVDEQSFRVVEGEGFKHLLRQLQPQFSTPSRYTVATDCFKLYLDEKARLKAFSRSDCNRVALTTDCWTSVQNLNYLALTAHFIDNEWKYQKRVISFSIIPNHKGETIGKKIEEVLREWGLMKLSTITVDNASSNDVAVGYLKRKMANLNGLIMDGDYLHMRCCAHILNLIVNEGLKENDSSIASVRNAVRFVRSSPQRLAKFKELVEFSQIECKKLLCLDVPTRWNSTYLMLDVAEKYEVVFEKLEFEDSSYVVFFANTGPPTKKDWDNIRAFLTFLKIFYEATRVFSSSLHVSIHTAFHQLADIHDEIHNSAMNLNTILGSMSWEMKGKYDKYWGNLVNINALLYFGVVLDPRYKLGYLRWSFWKMYNSEDGVDIVKKKLLRMYNWYKSAHEDQNKSSQSSHHAFHVAETSVLAETASHLARTNAFKQHLREQNAIDRQNELETYLNEANIDGEEKFDILFWWKQNSSRFPILSTMVKDILATPVSTVASESTFSTGGRVVDAFRSSLNPEMAEALICAQNRLRPSLNQLKDLNVNEELEISEKILTEFQGGANGATTTAGTATTTGCGPSQSSPTTVGGG